MKKKHSRAVYCTYVSFPMRSIKTACKLSKYVGVKNVSDIVGTSPNRAKENWYLKINCNFVGM